MPPSNRDSQSMPLTDEKIRRITIGELRPHDGPIILVAYDPDWAQHFLREAGRIRAALGDRTLRIEHIGSTAMPGLVASDHRHPSRGRRLRR